MQPVQPIPLQQLTPAQLELLQLLAGGLTDDQLAELRHILLEFKFRRATALADQFADSNEWRSDDLAKDAQDNFT